MADCELQQYVDNTRNNQKWSQNTMQAQFVIRDSRILTLRRIRNSRKHYSICRNKIVRHLYTSPKDATEQLNA